MRNKIILAVSLDLWTVYPRVRHVNMQVIWFRLSFKMLVIVKDAEVRLSLAGGGAKRHAGLRRGAPRATWTLMEGLPSTGGHYTHCSYRTKTFIITTDLAFSLLHCTIQFYKGFPIVSSE